MEKQSGWSILNNVMHEAVQQKYLDKLWENPTDVEALIKVGRCLSKGGHYFESMILMEHALKLGRHDGWKFWLNFSASLYQLCTEAAGWTTFSRFFLSKAHYAISRAMSFMENMTDPIMFSRKANVLFRLGQFGEATNVLSILCKRFISHQSDVCVIRLSLQLEIVRGNVNGAMRDLNNLDRALTISNKRRTDDYSSADVTLLRRILREINLIQVGGSSRQFCATAKEISDLGALCLTRGDFALACQVYTVGISVTEENAQIQAEMYCKQGYALMGYGQTREANKSLRKAVSLGCIDAEETLTSWNKGYKSIFTEHMNTPIQEMLERVQELRRKHNVAQKGKEKLSNAQMDRVNEELNVTPRSSNDSMPSLESEPQMNGKEADEMELTTECEEIQTNVSVLSKKEEAIKALKLLESSQYGGSGRHSNGFLSCTFQNVASRRAQSIRSYQRLGYAGHASIIHYWEVLLEESLGLFDSLNHLRRAVATVKAFDSKITTQEAFCALVECFGSTEEARGKISHASYHSELECICEIIDINSYFRAFDKKQLIKKKKKCVYEQSAGGKMIAFDLREIVSPSIPVVTEQLSRLEHENEAVERLCQGLRPSEYRVNSLIDQALEQRHEKERMSMVDSWGSPDKVGKNYSRGRDLFTPLQLSFHSYQDALRYSR